ncbi:MAG: (Fe-S)-binding protein [Pseudomonadota bacterium]
MSLFIPCLVDRFLPEIGESTVQVLRRCGHRVAYDDRQTCCGQPAYNAGHVDEATALARRFLDLFGDAEAVVAPSGSCVSMVTRHYGELPLSDRDMRRWSDLRGRVWELARFLDVNGDLDGLGARWHGRVGLHHSCHFLRELDGAEASLRRLLGRVEGLETVDLSDGTTCCGFGGSFSAKFPDVSVDMGRDKLASIDAAAVDAVALADAGCLLQLRGIQRAERREGPPILHYVQLLTGDGGAP